ncbi:cadherin-like beta sandwich domain-containing protein [Haliangium sp.]|uniref:cadherin-like beta sandwich domain-containing protein n=1 Tax=Haliangium sp. TaxID=2663208 RepID=UPI003D0D3B85
MIRTFVPVVGVALSLACALAPVGCGGDDGGVPMDQPDATPLPTPDAALDTDAALSALQVSAGTLSPPYTIAVEDYRVTLSLLADSITVTATARSELATILVNGTQVVSGQPSELIPAAPGDSLVTVEVIAEAGNRQTYTISIDRTLDAVEQRYVKPTTPDSGDQLGAAVALDGELMAMGAPFESSGNPDDPADNSAIESGAVLVFRREGPSWMPDAYLKASNLGDFDHFGSAVALDGDTLAVAAVGESSADPANPDDNGAESSGAVYVFRRDGTSWVEEAYLKAESPGANDAFGTSLALAGDLLAVGAPSEDSADPADPSNNGALNSGAVYVFQRSGDQWQQVAYLKASNLDAGDAFGASLGLDAGALAVGATGEDSADAATPDDDSLGAAGAVYVFEQGVGAWDEVAYLKPGTIDGNDAFGTSLGLLGDTLVVGTPGEDSGKPGNSADNGLSDSGAVFVFVRTESGWGQRAYLKAGNPDVNDRFGTTLALDQVGMVVNAPGEDSGSANEPDDDGTSDSGAVYLYLGQQGTWSQAAYLKAANAEANDSFGAALSITLGALAVGAPQEDSGVKVSPFDNTAAESGAVYVFE